MRAILVATLALMALGCSIDHVSDELACTTPADCSGGRSCIEGYCVESSTQCPGS